MSQIAIQEKSLLSPRADFLMIAGASLFFLVGFHFLVPATANINSVSWIMYYLAFAVNHPHFMLSYQLLYVDHRTEILKKPSYFWAAILCPALLLGLLGWAFTESSPTVFPFLVQVMFFTVGWHYIKQIFGTMVVSSAQKKFFFSRWEKWSLLFNLYSLALLSFVASQRVTATYDFYGIKYPTLGLPEWTFYLSYGVVFTSLAVFLLATLQRYIKTGEVASRWAWVSFVGIYAWYLPLLYHPHFFLLVPFFHSLQYLLFVFALKKNLWSKEAPTNVDGPLLRQYYVKKYATYFSSALILGALFFWLIPTTADQFLVSSGRAQPALWGATICLAAFNLFLNLHHYFIDNVIWRKDNEQLKKGLFS